MGSEEAELTNLGQKIVFCPSGQLPTSSVDISSQTRQERAILTLYLTGKCCRIRFRTVCITLWNIYFGIPKIQGRVLQMGRSTELNNLQKVVPFPLPLNQQAQQQIVSSLRFLHSEVNTQSRFPCFLLVSKVLGHFFRYQPLLPIG